MRPDPAGSSGHDGRAPESTASGQPASAAPDEYGEKFRTLRRQLIRAVRQACGADPQAAEDAVTSAFVKLYRDWHRIRHVRPWLLRTAINEYLASEESADARRSREQRFHRFQPATSPSPETAYIEGEQDARLQELLDQLGFRQRAVVTLDLYGYKTAEIAEILQMGESTVRSTLRHGRARLQTLIAERGAKRPARGVALGEEDPT